MHTSTQSVILIYIFKAQYIDTVPKIFSSFSAQNLNVATGSPRDLFLAYDYFSLKIFSSSLK